MNIDKIIMRRKATYRAYDGLRIVAAICGCAFVLGLALMIVRGSFISSMFVVSQMASAGYTKIKVHSRSTAAHLHGCGRECVIKPLNFLD